MILREAPRRLTPRTWLLALAGNAALFLLGWAWLYIPDSHTWQLLVSVLLAAAILAGFLALHASLIRRLHPPAPNPLWRSALLLAGWLLLAHILQHLAGLLRRNIETRAGYWNSQLSPHHRAFFTYERLIDSQNLALETLLWIVIPTLLLPFLVETVARAEVRSAAPWRTALATLHRPQLWLPMALAYIGGAWLGNRLLAWQPGHSAAGEVTSLAVRSILVYGLAVSLLLLTLAVVAQLLAQTPARRNPAP